jgi:hypothetical protein
MISTVYAVASRFGYRSNPPERDWRYLRFIRQFPCVGCGRSGRGVEAMHTGPHGLGQKADDRQALPGCPACHRTGPNALHKIGPVRFQELHRISFPDLWVYFQGMYKG